MKKFIVSLFLIISLITPVFAEADYDIVVDGQFVKFDKAVVVRDADLLIPLDEVDKILLFSTFDPSTNQGFVYTDYDIITFKPGNNTIPVQLDGVNSKMTGQPAEVINGVFYVPLKVMCQVAEAELSIDSNGKIIIVMPKTHRIVEFDNGSVYDGEFLFNGNTKHGYGKYTWSDGGEYEGQWYKGERTGKGKYVWEDGAYYEGDFVDGVRTGKGKITWSDGSFYVGDFLEGQITGNGALFSADGKLQRQGYFLSGEYQGDFIEPEVAKMNAYKDAAYDGPGYEELLKNETPYLGQATYFSGEVLVIEELDDGSTYLLIDLSAFTNAFLDMNYIYGDGTYLGEVESQILAIYSPTRVDILQGDSIQVYGDVIQDLIYYDSWGNTVEYPSIELKAFERTSMRSDEILDKIIGN